MVLEYLTRFATVKKLLIFILFVFPLFVFSQYRVCDYALPVDIPVELSANFGELRKNHFHTGIDIKTQGAINKNIRAIEDGYVSRLRISPYGYGKTIYITHPKTGHVSVYAHLNSFSQKIQDKIFEYQYANLQNNIDFYLPDSSLLVYKGELIALSGNSGSSMGPHLHFEIRDAKTEHAINPFHFYPRIYDNIRPRIYTVAVYPLNDSSHVRSANVKSIFTPRQTVSGEYAINTPIQSYGQIGIGVQVQDFITYSPNKFGVYRIVVVVNSDTIYQHRLDEIDFAESKYINSMVDYEYWAYTTRWIQQLWKDNLSELSIYSELKNWGKLTIADDSLYRVNVSLYDFHGNNASVSLLLKGKKQYINHQDNCDNLVLPEEDYYYSDAIVSAKIPKGTIYEPVCFYYAIDSAVVSGDHSYLYSVVDKGIPLHKSIQFSFPIDSLAKKYPRQTYICEKKGNKNIYRGGIVSYDRIFGKIDAFGSFVARIDTIAPYVKPMHIFNGVNLTSRSSIRFVVRDKESGIHYYSAYIDNQWVPLYYDYKDDMLYFSFDDKKNPPSNSLHIFRLLVCDYVGNESEYVFNFVR